MENDARDRSSVVREELVKFEIEGTPGSAPRTATRGNKPDNERTVARSCEGIVDIHSSASRRGRSLRGRTFERNVRTAPGMRRQVMTLKNCNHRSRPRSCPRSPLVWSLMRSLGSLLISAVTADIPTLKPAGHHPDDTNRRQTNSTCTGQHESAPPPQFLPVPHRLLYELVGHSASPTDSAERTERPRRSAREANAALRTRISADARDKRCS